MGSDTTGRMEVSSEFWASALGSTWIAISGRMMKETTVQRNPVLDVIGSFLEESERVSIAILRAPAESRVRSLDTIYRMSLKYADENAALCHQKFRR